MLYDVNRITYFQIIAEIEKKIEKFENNDVIITRGVYDVTLFEIGGILKGVIWTGKYSPISVVEP